MSVGVGDGYDSVAVAVIVEMIVEVMVSLMVLGICS